MRNAALDKLIWVLIYSGLLFACLGAFVMRGDAVLGWIIVIAGVLDAVAGAVLIWLRSRRKT